MKLSRKLVLEERSRTADGMGGADVAWVTVGTLWGQLVARSGGEGFSNAEEASRQAWRITVRGAPKGAPSRPRADQRFREGTRIFNILSVAEADPEGRYLICNAEEGLAV
ncbi:MAG: head-tail adaptor protein [Pseudomonadota bacterium]